MYLHEHQGGIVSLAFISPELRLDVLCLALGYSNSYTELIVIAVLWRYLKRDYQINERHAQAQPRKPSTSS